MDPRLEALAAQGGIFTSDQLRGAGYETREIQRGVRGGRWRRVRRGVLALPADDDRETHLRALRALCHRLDRDLVVSHESAALVWRLDLWGPHPHLLHVTRRSASAVEDAGVRYRVAALPVSHVTAAEGLPVTTLARTAVDLARHGRDLEHAVVAVDAVRRIGVTEDELRQVLADCSRWPGVRQARRALSASVDAAESVGETRARLLLTSLGLEVTPQAVLRDGPTFVARVNFLVEPLRLVVEFDGRVKYGLAEDWPADALWREKLREDRIRALGYDVVRLVWADLDQPAAVARVIERVRARRAAR